MKIKNLSIILTLLLLITPAVYADLWDKEKELSYGKVKSDATWDERKFQYEGGVDFDRAKQTRDLEIKFKHKMGLGCSGFGIGENLFNDMTGQALTDYATGILKEALAASPELLLAYLSPTLYDKLKELKSHSAKLLKLKFKTCEEMQGAAMKSDWMLERQQNVRGKALSYDAASGRFLEKSIKEASQIKNKSIDYYGKEVDNYKPITDGVKWLKGKGYKEKILDELVALAGDYQVPREGPIEIIPFTKTATDFLTKNRKEIEKKLKEAVKTYKQEKKVSNEDLKELSIASVPMEPTIIESITVMSPNDQTTAIGKVASELAFIQTIWQLNYLVEKTQMLAEAQHDAVDKKQVHQKADNLKSQKKALLEERQFVERATELVKESTLEKAERKRAESLEKVGEAGTAIKQGQQRPLKGSYY